MFVLYIILGLLGMKLLYNLTVPYQLLRKQDETAGISVMVVVEWLLLIVALILSFIINPEAAQLKLWTLAGIGVSAILATYVHFALIMVLGGWFVVRKKR